MKRWALVLVLLLMAGRSFAAPAISSYSGTPSNNESLTFYGTGFGLKSVVAPLVHDDFESGGTAGQSVTASTGTSWTTDGTAPVLSTENNRTGVPGSRNAKAVVSGLNIDGNHHDLMFVGGMNLVPKFYAAVWARLASNPTGEQVKYWRLASAASTAYPTYSFFRTDGWARYQWTNPSGSTCTTAGAAWFDSVENTNLGSWQLLEMIGNLGTVGSANGSIRVYHNGVDQGGVSNTTLLTSASCAPTGFRFGEYIQDYDLSVTNYFDDVYIDNSWARVYLTNASTLAASTHRELQIPTAWADGVLTVRVNRGSFPAGSSVYVIVVDSEGVASSGFALTLDVGTAPTPVPTPSPTPSGATAVEFKLKGAKISR